MRALWQVVQVHDIPPFSACSSKRAGGFITRIALDERRVRERYLARRPNSANPIAIAISLNQRLLLIGDNSTLEYFVAFDFYRQTVECNNNKYVLDQGTIVSGKYCRGQEA